MKREIVINAAFGETRAAVLENERLVELYIEREPQQRLVGNIYMGRVENVLPGMQAAFVNIGLDKNAFLYVNDALDQFQMNGEKLNGSARGRLIEDVVRVGQMIAVQVTKEPQGTKGARVVTSLSIPGRYVVWMPGTDHVGVSRRITDEAERTRLRTVAEQIRPPEVGLIIRTEAEGKTEAELALDVQFLQQVWHDFQKRAHRCDGPSVLYKDHDLVHRTARDRFTAEVCKLVVDQEHVYDRVVSLVAPLSKSLQEKVYLYHEGPPIFQAYGIEKQIDKALERYVSLDCGGYLVIDHTEALTSIDVNTGRFTGSTNLADTVLQTNLEASVEIARQLRLRDIGGIIIVDFIDMDTVEDENRVLTMLEREVRRDKTRTHILGFTNLGLVEMTRQKVRRDIENVFQKPCPTCRGSGQVVSETTVAYRVQREIKRQAQCSDAEAMLVECHPAVAAVIIGTGGTNLRRLEEAIGKWVYVKGTEGLDINDLNFRVIGTKAQVEEEALPVRVGEQLTVSVAEQHISNSRDGIARMEGYVIDVEGAGGRVGEQLLVQITRVFRTYAKAKVI